VGLAVGLLVAFSIYVVGVEDLSYAVFKEGWVNDLWQFFWQGSALVFYLTVWLMPTQGTLARDTRRPAVIYWARFWFMFRFLITLSGILEEYDVDFGYCLFHITVFIFFAVLKCWVCYRVFVLEAMWWHGVPGSGTPIPCLFCVSGEVKDGVVGTLLAGLMRAPSTESSKVELRASCETSNINEPFANIQLTEQSASAMSNAMDQLGRARGDSLERMEGGDRQKEKNSRRATLFNGISRLTTRSAQRKLLGGGTVPLIDFSRLKIILSRLLGMGSTARVYEGRWCGRKVAVKVLFTVEITPAEIQRTCMEASLLHSLQSPNVVRLFGIAVLPPSLCVVLEVCSEGSLGDVLYSMEDKREARAVSNILGRLSASGRLSTTDQLSSTGRGSVTGRKAFQI
jgi:hypothetical protein